MLNVNVLSPVTLSVLLKPVSLPSVRSRNGVFGSIVSISMRLTLPLSPEVARQVRHLVGDVVDAIGERFNRDLPTTVRAGDTFTNEQSV